MTSVKKNFFYSSILTVSNYIFPLLVFPYISRVLGVTNIGICNFVDGIINYYVLISMLGISSVGIREVARARIDLKKTGEIFSSLFFLNAITTFIALLILVISIFYIPQLYEHKELMYIGIIKLVSNFLLIEWFYTGLERFKFITNRTIIVKLLYVASVFLLIKESKDYILYYFLTTIMITLNAIMNTWFARSYFRFDFSSVNFKYFFRPSFVLGVYAILTSMYISFNVIFLGFSSNTTEVGYYTTASKLYTIILALYTAFTNVMMPRMSFLLGEGKIDEFRKMISQSQDILLGFAIPLCIITVVFAPEIIYIIAGKGYEGAVLPMRIIMPLIIIIGYEQILVLQILTPLKKDRAIFINSVFGAIVGIVLNLLLVPIYKSIGSSVVWFVSECIVLVSSQYFVSKYLQINFPYKKFLKNILWAIPGILITLFIKKMVYISPYLEIFISATLIGIYFFVVHIYILKNDFYILYLNRFLHSIKIKKQM